MNNESKPNNVFGKTPSLLVVVMWFTHTGKSGLAQQTAVSVRGLISREIVEEWNKAFSSLDSISSSIWLVWAIF